MVASNIFYEQCYSRTVDKRNLLSAKVSNYSAKPDGKLAIMNYFQRSDIF